MNSSEKATEPLLDQTSSAEGGKKEVIMSVIPFLKKGVEWVSFSMLRRMTGKVMEISKGPVIPQLKLHFRVDFL